MLLQSMSLCDRFTCALVCKAWAEAATAATHTIILEHSMEDLSSLQCWLEQHGSHLEVLQLHQCDNAVLTALPCAQLQNLLLKGHVVRRLRIDTRVWSDIAAATKLTSVTLEYVQTASQQAEVVSALTALPDLEQLTWYNITCSGQWWLTDSSLLKKLTKLTTLCLDSVEAAEAFRHAGGLTRLQDLSIGAGEDWAAAGCPGLQELKTLTRLELTDVQDSDGIISSSVTQLTALQELDIWNATAAALNKLQALSRLTQLCVLGISWLWLGPAALQLPGLQHLKLENGDGTMPVSFLASCTQLRVLKLSEINLSPGILFTSTLLQHLKLDDCHITAADDAAGPVSWQQLFPGPGQLPHLTSLQLTSYSELQELLFADIECVVACCSNLKVLDLDTLPDNSASALACLPGLTSLTLWEGSDEQCSLVAQLTGLRELRLNDLRETSVAGLVQLAALQNLTCLGYG